MQGKNYPLTVNCGSGGKEVKFLIIDDAPEVVEAVSLCLELSYEGAILLTANDGKSGLELAQKENLDLIILDIGLPDSDGFQICRKIRTGSDVPIMVLTVRDRDVDVAHGLAAGADYYMTKPFNHIEFLARVQTLLRRSKEGKLISQGAFTAGDLTVNWDTREACLSGQKIMLTPIEFRLVYRLFQGNGKVITHEQLLTSVWGPEYVTKTGSLRMQIQRLRQKLGDSGSSPRLIRTEPGVGYRFVMPGKETSSI